MAQHVQFIHAFGLAVEVSWSISPVLNYHNRALLNLELSLSLGGTKFEL
jgi:hypothetical protein